MSDTANAPTPEARARIDLAAFVRALRAPLPREIGWRDQLIGAAFAVVYVAWLLGTARGLGFARDEGFYFHAASQYANWFQQLMDHGKSAMQQSSVDPYWGANHEHPSLMKSLFALSWMFLYKKWHFFSDASTAFRFPGMVMAGIGLWVTYLFGARAFSRPAGLIAAPLLGLMPHLFYNAHLACFDMPIATMWLVSVYAFYRASERGTFEWAIVCGVAYGLTLETKHNAWILPAVFVPHAIFVYGRWLLGGRKPSAIVPWHLAAVGTIGPLVFYALWPWIWFDTEARVRDYVNFHVHHEYYNIEFLGRNVFGPPSPMLYAPLLIAASVPTVTLLLCGVGAFDRLRENFVRLQTFFTTARAERARPTEGDSPAHGCDAATDLLIGLAFAGPLAVFFLPTTPIFGGTKHWMPAYPFLAILAGRGFVLSLRAFDTLLSENRLPARIVEHARSAPHLAPWLLGVAAVLGPFFVTKHSHPFGLSAYVPIVGGTAGGADLGLNRQFWGYTTESLGPWLETNAPPNATLFIHDTAWPSWERMIAEKRIRPDIRGVGSPSEAQLAIVHHELHMNEVDYSIWIGYGTVAPEYILRHDGVPIISLYRRR
jgi:hypothetical protein